MNNTTNTKEGTDGQIWRKKKTDFENLFSKFIFVDGNVWCNAFKDIFVYLILSSTSKFLANVKSIRE